MAGFLQFATAIYSTAIYVACADANSCGCNLCFLRCANLCDCNSYCIRRRKFMRHHRRFIVVKQICYLSSAVSNNVLQFGFLSSRTQNAKTSVAANRTKNAAA